MKGSRTSHPPRLTLNASLILAENAKSLQWHEPANKIGTELPWLVKRWRPALSLSRAVERIGRIEYPDPTKLVAVGERRAIILGNRGSVAAYTLRNKLADVYTCRTLRTRCNPTARRVISSARVSSSWSRRAATPSASVGRSVVVGLDDLEVDGNDDRYHDHSQSSESD
jgi:hypothetical protein